MMKAVKDFMDKLWTWGDLLQAVRRCRRSVLRTHRRHRGMGELEGTQGTEGSSEEV